MSRTREQNNQNRPVLVRAFGDEPLKLIAGEGGDDRVVELALDDKTVLFPKNDVFSFDEGLFKKLKKAFGMGDEAALRTLWSEAG